MKNFLLGLLSGALAIAIWMLKTAKPVINTDTYVESVEQQIKKLKGNENSLSNLTRRERRQEKRKLRKLKNKSHD